jgi:DNA-binding IclR family transcriptional regulator
VGYGAVSVASAVTDDALVRRVRPLLADLAVRTGESVLLAVAKRFNLVYVDQVDPPGVMTPSWLGKPLPLHATSGGKVFLAWLRLDERDAILPQDLPRYTSRTITDREQLERELDAVRRTGYAICTREYEEFSSGVSAAVLNSRRYPIAVVNVWGPAPRNPAKRLHEIGREAVQAAGQVHDLLSGTAAVLAALPRPARGKPTAADPSSEGRAALDRREAGHLLKIGEAHMAPDVAP